MTIARNTVEFASLIAGSCFGDAVTLRALEVNQGAQDWHNSKTLLQARETIVRAFVETPAGAPDQRVTGRLIGRRDGVELPGQPARGHQHLRQRARAQRHRRPAAARSTTRSTSSCRSAGPTPAATRARVRRRRRAGGLQGALRPGHGGRRLPRQPAVRDADELGVAFFGVEIDGDRARAGSDIAEQTARVQSALPVSTFNMSSARSTTTTRPSIDDLNDDLHRMREVERTSCTDGCATFARDVFYGLIDGRAARRAQRQGQRHPGRRRVVVHQQPQQPDLAGLRPQHGRARDQPLARRAPRGRQLARRERRLPVVGQATRPAAAARSASTDAPGHDPVHHGRRGHPAGPRPDRATPTTRSGASTTASRAPTRAASASPIRRRPGR